MNVRRFRAPYLRGGMTVGGQRHNKTRGRKPERLLPRRAFPEKEKAPRRGLLKLFFGGLLPCGDVGADKLLDVAGFAGHAFKKFEYVIILWSDEPCAYKSAALFVVFVLCGVACALFVGTGDRIC